MNPNEDFINTKVKEKFQLFQGVRSQEEDQMIYDKLMVMCFDEMLKFVAVNLKDKERSELKEKLEKGDDDIDKVKLLSTALFSIKNHQEKLTSHLDNYLDNVVEESLKAKKN